MYYNCSINNSANPIGVFSYDALLNSETGFNTSFAGGVWSINTATKKILFDHLYDGAIQALFIPTTTKDNFSMELTVSVTAFNGAFTTACFAGMASDFGDAQTAANSVCAGAIDPTGGDYDDIRALTSRSSPPSKNYTLPAATIGDISVNPVKVVAQKLGANFSAYFYTSPAWGLVAGTPKEITQTANYANFFMSNYALGELNASWITGEITGVIARPLHSSGVNIAFGPETGQPAPPEPPVIPNVTALNVPAETSYCADDNTLYIAAYNVNETGNLVMGEKYARCNFGCSNSTITALGNPGCKESNMVLMVMLIIAAILIIIVIRWLAT